MAFKKRGRERKGIKKRMGLEEKLIEENLDDLKNPEKVKIPKAED